MHRFDQDIAILAQPQPNQYESRIAPHWSIAGLPNGGYLMALMANTMFQQQTKNSIAIMTANYMARTKPGDARIDLEKITVSKQFERFEARLYQQDKEKVRAIGTLMETAVECTVNRNEAQVPGMAPLDQCPRFPELPDFTLFDQMEVRLDPACTGWMTGSLVERSEHKGWIRFKDERPYDALALLLIADAFPPPAFATQGMAAWVPTIELSVNIRKLPTTPWLKCLFRTRFITCGMLEEDGQIWDEAGELIAVSRQIAQFRL